jgi:hypothetical protein
MLSCPGIKSRADALANLPSLGKVAPRKRDAAVPATKQGKPHTSALLGAQPVEGFS